MIDTPAWIPFEWAVPHTEGFALPLTFHTWHPQEIKDMRASGVAPDTIQSKQNPQNGVKNDGEMAMVRQCCVVVVLVVLAAEKFS